MTTYYLHRWSLMIEDDPYQAPETRQMYLVGFRGIESKQIITSAIKEFSGRNVITWSGTCYILRDMDTEYRDWLILNNKEVDWDNPFKP